MPLLFKGENKNGAFERAKWIKETIREPYLSQYHSFSPSSPNDRGQEASVSTLAPWVIVRSQRLRKGGRENRERKM